MDKRGLLSFNLKNVVLAKWIKEVSERRPLLSI
jgi:hypothetical protein